MPRKKHYSSTDLSASIQGLLEKKAVGTQEEIRDALLKKGIPVNQVRVSRILHKLGAIKMNEDGKIVYRLPSDAEKYFVPKEILKKLISRITHNESLVVIQTVSGSGQVVARLLDLTKNLDILGTVAGDDTIFVAPKTTKNIETLFKKIYNLLLN
ncbi:MAG: Arginine repressor [uncultured bacterium]|nr:MAG: Arginine repressor [uncultured bacterium]OGT16975.1 MAG: hypothetical protein A3B69_01325 [Gammaproteobacteria bacterium RIFCSPHIGHO2_02_FULL_38_33]OGT24588.1 MAG: hypothetical protein A2W47_02895 [Gammaproteobacteria bacterium RIFCSPHIGHO2_12_38_15]OGT69034.1 MAG: hypothetical protein A3I12_01685 [Gammaproteobacteria bacterium RIFCSPLOWO2_02_FULL_38_11]OGT75625.1 MAG: hypothetical protein A3G71_06725 [Gammaproteobacteria bacterium RIFCSPLOWO2_12_FULL_38_14]